MAQPPDPNFFTRQYTPQQLAATAARNHPVVQPLAVSPILLAIAAFFVVRMIRK
jgi:hypothetical protein